MSSPSSTSSSSPSSSPSQEPVHRPLGLANSSNLYLITFLATLFLLLIISCSIVLRSYVLRRRFQRQLDVALAAGIILAPHTQGSRKRRFGARPKFFTSWVAQGGDKWNEMMPVSALPFQVKRRCKGATASSPSKHDQQPSSSPTISPEPSTIRARLLRVMHWRDDIKSELPVVTPLDKPPRVRMDMLQVSVLIAMPTSNRPTTPSLHKLDDYDYDDDDDEDDEIPEVVFGITRLPYKPNSLT
ncbi:hypothetical protein Hypma_000922 [Hypsizygus marmoreus]|uniref:Uncharacterized protein n=1 Tax=Hypsizygus marmoreus TaxID=39966 RepID=A0A369JGG5_HYPMA|nr:hypothetical protein Hypma_000922 [Hypsizygus marmoreus]